MQTNYVSVSQKNSTFNQPRQKTWIVFQLGTTGWNPKLTTTSFSEAQDEVKAFLCAGGQYTNINRIMVAELVPIDLLITPQV